MRRVDRPLEVRWFIAGEVPTEPQPSGRFEQRTDWCHVDSLSADTSIKRRGNGGALELKRRMGGTILFERETVIGYAEQWIKERLCDPGSTRLLTGDWIGIHKELWSTRVVQVARVSVHCNHSWTIAATLRNGSLATSAVDVLDQWLPTIAAHGQATSYPSWLYGEMVVGAATSRFDERSWASSPPFWR